MKPTTLLSLLAFTGAFLNAQMASAQSLPPSVRTPEADNTLGTQVAGNGNNFNITGGLNRGQTLFHSFKDFSIPTGGAANFNNPAGTRDIISRVTGNLFSDINGTLNSNGANFLLINPNGVVFGPNAKLNVGKAFAASTASGVDLIDGQGRQITFGTNPNGDAPLLTINPNVFFNVSRLNMGASVPNNTGIVNYGTLQTNNDSQYIGLIGGNVTLDGKYGGGKIFAPGGRVDLGGLNSAGTISTDLQGLVFGGNGLVRGDVLLTDGASVSARANGTLGTVNPFFSNVAVAGSNININANNLNILNSGAKLNTGFAAIDNGLAENSGVKTQPAGNININATGLVNLDNAQIKNTLRSGAEGKIGDVKINANSLSLINGSTTSSVTAGKGNAGDVNITTTGDIIISGTTPQSTQAASVDKQSFISSDTFGQGNAGKITIDTQATGKLLLSNLGNISSTVGEEGVGNGNTISISAQAVDLQNVSFITSSTLGKGDAGNIDIKTTGDISISGSNPQLTNSNSLSSISSDTFGQGNAGKITIDTQASGKLLLSNFGIISSTVGSKGVGNGNTISISAQAVDLQNVSFITSSTFGKGDAGNIDIKTTGDISISGSNPQLPNSNSLSSISSFTNGQGNAGKITIDTQDRGKFLLSNSGAIISGVDSQGVGNGNTISIFAKEIDLQNGSSIFSSTLGKGDAGNIIIDTTGALKINDSSSISTLSGGKGKAGDILLTSDRIILNNSDNAIGSQSVKAKGGNIQINTQDFLLLKNSSNIFTNSFSTDNNGNGGNIAINSPLIIALPGDNNIVADAVGGNGGRVDITSQGLFGSVSLLR